MGRKATPACRSAIRHAGVPLSRNAYLPCAGTTACRHGSRMLGIAGLPKQKYFLGARGVFYRGLFFNILGLDLRRVVQMSILRRCPFYRDSEMLTMQSKTGYCDLDYDRTTCEGDTYICEKYDVLRKHLLEQKRMEGDLG